MDDVYAANRKMAKRIAELEAQNKRLKRETQHYKNIAYNAGVNAERYQWLKANQVSRMPGGWGYSLSISWGSDTEIDAVIDAAREDT